MLCALRGKKDAFKELCVRFSLYTDKFTGWLTNRTRTGNRNRRNRFSRNRKRNRNRQNHFPGTEARTGTVLSCNCAETRKKPFLRRNRRSREPEPLRTEASLSLATRIISVKRGQTCTFHQTCTLFSARLLVLTASRLPSMPSSFPSLLLLH